MITARRRAHAPAPTPAPAVEAVRPEAPKSSPVVSDAAATTASERPAKASGPKPGR